MTSISKSTPRIIFNVTLAIALASTLVVTRCGGGKSEREKGAEWERFIDFIKKEKWDRE